MSTKTIDRTGEAIYKTAAGRVTKVDDGGEGGPGSFEALVAVYDNIDSQGDMVVKGAFTEAIAGGAEFPSFWAHQFYDDTAVIGAAKFTETDDGLLMSATFIDTDRAQNIRRLMAAGLIKEFSWSGRVVEGSWIDKEGEGRWNDGYYEIRKVDLWEAGPCFKGANPDTELLGVKSAVDRLATKEGRVLAQKHVDSLKGVRDTLDGVIAAVEKVTDEDEEKSADTTDPQALPAGETGSDTTVSEHDRIKARLALS